MAEASHDKYFRFVSYALVYDLYLLLFNVCDRYVPSISTPISFVIMQIKQFR